MSEHDFTALVMLCGFAIWGVQIGTAWHDHRASAEFMAELRKIAASRRAPAVHNRCQEDCQ